MSIYIGTMLVALVSMGSYVPCLIDSEGLVLLVVPIHSDHFLFPGVP